MRLEPEVWDALREICIREGLELRELIKQVEKTAAPGGRTSAVRVHVLQYFRAASTDEGHVLAGHGTKTVTGPLRLTSEIEVDGATLEA
jgi:predicted DNA-binding ribbon-helix-helix protein